MHIVPAPWNFPNGHNGGRSSLSRNEVLMLIMLTPWGHQTEMMLMMLIMLARGCRREKVPMGVVPMMFMLAISIGQEGGLPDSTTTSCLPL